jgi:PPE-repeat protein
MAAAVQPYMTWLNTTAAAAEHAASQAMASAAAYEAAFAMTVPPPVIAANRAQLAALVATNFLGQNTPAIAANEAHYGEMWAQDAAAMYGYAGSSASAGVLQPLSSPAPNTNPAGLAAAATQASAGSAQSGLSQLVSGLPNAMQTLASPLADSTAPATPGFLSNIINSTQNVGLFNAIQTYSTYGVNAAIWHIFAGAASAIAIATEGGALPGGPILADAAAPAAFAAPAASPGLGATPVLASVGQSAPVGGLSVPPAWSAATPAAADSVTLASTGGSGWTAATEEGSSMTTVPAGMPAVASAGRGGFGFGTPRYGFKPTVMHRPVMVG